MQDGLFEYYSTVRQKKVEWLWYPYIAYGKLTVLQRDPEEGKSTFIINVAALLTKCLPMPDGSRVSKARSVTYQCAEDNLADTIKPRLIQTGADCDRVAYIVEEDKRLTLDDERIEKTLQETNARLMIIDPIQTFLSQDSDMQSAIRMRAILRCLSDLADKYRCAVALVGHMNKTTAGKNLYRGLGSIDIAAIARSVLMIIRDADHPQTRYMIPIKSSLAPEGSAIAFCFDQESGLKWLGKCSIEYNKLKEEQSKRYPKNELARKYLLEQLSECNMPSRSILAHLAELGISERTVNQAKKDLHIEAYHKGNAWYWRLPAMLQMSGKEDNSK